MFCVTILPCEILYTTAHIPLYTLLQISLLVTLFLSELHNRRHCVVNVGFAQCVIAVDSYAATNLMTVDDTAIMRCHLFCFIYYSAGTD